MKKLTLLVVMAVLCPFLSKEKGAKSKDGSTNNKQGATKYMVMLLLIIFYGFAALAQEPQKISPLNVGDKVPESFWKQEHAIYQNGKATRQTLAAYKGKLLILDFWATWCSSCFKKMPLLDSMQKANPMLMNVVMVNTINTADDITKIKARLKAGLPTIYKDSVLLKAFPNRLLPHYVWVSASGQVVAITDYDFLTRTNLQQLLYRTQQYQKKTSLTSQ